MFKMAIVRKPGQSLVNGLTTSNLGQPDYELALLQHIAYVEALKSCGLDVVVLEADEDYPDSTFVEDTALLTPRCAIIALPGAPSRQGEIQAMHEELARHFGQIELVHPPGTVEGGDIMMVGSHFYIGLSERTNEEGAQQVIKFLEKYGLSGSTIHVQDSLHLKTGVAYLENDTLVGFSPYIDANQFRDYRIIEVDPEESYASNCIWVNGKVLVAKGYPETADMIRNAGYPVIEVDVSEFRKLDGGLSCLSLRF